MNSFKVSGSVKRFPGKYGWHYITLDDDLSRDFRGIVKENWPSLLGATFTINKTTWKSSIMPIKDGPLFIALPVKIRKAENIKEGQTITVHFKIDV